MRAGKLRHRVAIQTVTETPDEAYGTETKSWATATTVWASIEPMAGGERFARYMQINDETTHLVRMRYTAYAAQNARLIHDSRTFQVLSVLNREEKDADLQLLCKEMA